MVNSFQYMAQVILLVDDHWLAMVRNLYWGRVVWKMNTITLSREGEEPRLSVLFFKSVLQAVLLFGLDTLVVTPCMGRSLWDIPGPGGEADDMAAISA